MVTAAPLVASAAFLIGRLNYTSDLARIRKSRRSASPDVSGAQGRDSILAAAHG
jgi:hypothetical protein